MLYTENIWAQAKLAPPRPPAQGHMPIEIDTTPVPIPAQAAQSIDDPPLLSATAEGKAATPQSDLEALLDSIDLLLLTSSTPLEHNACAPIYDIEPEPLLLEGLEALPLPPELSAGPRLEFMAEALISPVPEEDLAALCASLSRSWEAAQPGGPEQGPAAGQPDAPEQGPEIAPLIPVEDAPSASALAEAGGPQVSYLPPSEAQDAYAAPSAVEELLSQAELSRQIILATA